jgi:AraC-like DNA-binding protein
LGRTERTLLRRFTAQVGLSPKAFARVLRLHRLIASVPLRQEVDWARAASDYGYFDQPHLINDFRALTGTTPGGFHPRISDPTHIPLTG